jgi:phosphoserine phosphatase
MPEDKPFASAHQILKDTMTTAWMRPRFAGYIPWQAEAGRLTERLVRQELNAKNFCDQLLASWEAITPYKK